MKIGFVGLLESRKATLCLLILAISSVALFTKHLDSVSFAAVVSSIVLIYNFVQHRVDIASLPNEQVHSSDKGNSIDKT